MRTSRVSTSSAARWICEALVTSSVRGVTRLSGCCSALRVPAYTLFAPRLSASLTSARPMPRLAPVIKTVLFARFISVLLLDRCPDLLKSTSLQPIVGAAGQKDTDRTAQSPLSHAAFETGGG